MKITLITADYTVTPSTITVFRTDNGWHNIEKYDSKDTMHKRMWYVLHSPKVASVVIKSRYITNDIKSMVAYCNMIELPVHVELPTTVCKNTQELTNAIAETMHNVEMSMLTSENFDLIRKYCPELRKFVADTSLLIEVLQSQIKLSGYDVSLSSEDITDGLNCGRVETSKGVLEWSRDYTKHYTRYNTQLNDLLKMYISCKFLAENGFDVDGNPIQKAIDEDAKDINACSNCGWSTCKNCPRLTRDVDVNELITPVSACGEYIQMYLN